MNLRAESFYNNILKKYTSSNINLRSQDMRDTYFRNGASFISSIKFLKSSEFIIDDESVTFHEIPFIRPIKIDTLENWKLAETLYKNKND